jgi:hypothetical protein
MVENILEKFTKDSSMGVPWVVNAKTNGVAASMNLGIRCLYSGFRRESSLMGIPECAGRSHGYS